MTSHLRLRIILLMVICIMAPSLALAAHGDDAKKEDKTAIILASFGTTIPSGVESIVNIQRKIQEAYPGVPVKITFTSNIIRSVWKERQAEAQKWLGEGVPEEILYVKNIISTFGELLEEGYRNIIVQPTHIFFMEQSHDLARYVDAMRSIRTIKDKWRPFAKIALGRPALGTVGPRYDYTKDMEKALKTLADDAESARREKAALVYMGHGNEHWPSGIYAEAQKMMQELYPDVKTHIGVVEGHPGIDEVVEALAEAKSKSKIRRVVLKPFMIVAGDHALNDMAGDDEESWKSVLSAKKYQVIPVLKGLGSNDAFARIFVSHIRDAAKEVGIPLP
ncbi:MAG: sirohydrochlorin cobaltochelatase [Desulfobacterales bacterium]|nr:sirohydrochlorin cobaltochelatase [Desulfobacterales bacterium]